MSTYFLRTTDNTSCMLHARTDAEALQLARRAAKALRKNIQYVRRYDGTYGRPLPF